VAIGHPRWDIFDSRLSHIGLMQSTPMAENRKQSAAIYLWVMNGADRTSASVPIPCCFARRVTGGMLVLPNQQ